MKLVATKCFAKILKNKFCLRTLRSSWPIASALTPPIENRNQPQADTKLTTWLAATNLHQRGGVGSGESTHSGQPVSRSAGQPVSRWPSDLWVIVGGLSAITHNHPQKAVSTSAGALWVTVGSVSSDFKSLRLESITCAVYFLM